MADDTNASPLRILHCFREPTGGLFRHVRDLVGLQAEKGHAVGIVCDATTGGPREDALMEELRPKLALGLHRIAMQRRVGLGDAAAAYKTYRIIKKLQPDILHGHGAKGGVYARLFGSVLRVLRSRVARIYSPHGGSLHFDRKTRRGGAVFLIERLLAPLTDAVMFVSNFEKRIYEEKVGRPYGLHAVIYNGLAEDEFIPIADAAGASDFLFVGTMRELKGPDVMIRALARLRDRNQRALTATMVGRRRGKARLHRPCRRTRPFRANPLSARHGCARGLCPGAYNGGSVTRRSVSLYRSGGARCRKVRHRQQCWRHSRSVWASLPALVEPEEEALAHKMLGVADDPAAFRAAMPDAARLHERFSLQTMAHSIETIYYEAHPDRTVPED